MLPAMRIYTLDNMHAKGKEEKGRRKKSERRGEARGGKREREGKYYVKKVRHRKHKSSAIRTSYPDWVNLSCPAGRTPLR